VCYSLWPLFVCRTYRWWCYSFGPLCVTVTAGIYRPIWRNKVFSRYCDCICRFYVPCFIMVSTSVMLRFLFCIFLIRYLPSFVLLPYNFVLLHFCLCCPLKCSDKVCKRCYCISNWEVLQAVYPSVCFSSVILILLICSFSLCI
jgi:hypothetical protein